MSQESTKKLLKFLRCEEVAPSATTAALESTPAPFGIDSIRELREELRRDPEKVLRVATDILEETPTREQFELTLRRAEIALSNSTETLSMLEAGLGEDAPFDLPPEHRFRGYDKDKIPIFPGRTKFETARDAPAWAIHAAAAALNALRLPKPSFPRHSDQSPFDYPLQARDGKTTVALFSDWGTGYYHSRYIALHVEGRRPGQAIHLGDVYYAGREEEFDEYFTPVLDPLVATTPFYALNANHEMMSRGVPYLEYIQKKKSRGGQNGRVVQPQEGSYFCLANDHYQVIGIDTANPSNGRFREAHLKDWLAERLTRGRERKKVNILLSQNEPYGPVRGEPSGPRPLLTEDLKDLAAQIDLWFWGDEHYAALYSRGERAPFIGSCIGHGGYPYTRKESARDVAAGVNGVKVAWFEDESRFPAELNLRPTRGNNGFCHLTLERDEIQLQYVDWRLRVRRVFTFPVQQGRVTFQV